MSDHWEDYIEALTLSDADYEAWQAEENEFCETHGHMPGCAHDVTDWDSFNKERRMN